MNILQIASLVNNFVAGKRVRLRTIASRRFKSQINATRLIWKALMVAEMSFGKLNAPHLVEKVAEGKKYHNGKEVRVAA